MSCTRCVAAASVVVALMAGSAVAQERLQLPPNGVRIGGDIKPPAKVKDVKPEYPAKAREAGVAGTVILDILIDENGRVTATKILRSVPALDQAAVDAVRQWEFTPTRVEGKAVPVAMTITVKFTGLDTAIVPQPPSLPSVPATKADDPWYPPGAPRVGGKLQTPRKLVDVRPVYPDQAKQDKVQGAVIIEMVVGADGKVMKTRVLRSIPALDQAALDAVAQWEYEPVVVDGQARPFVLTATVSFTLR